MNLRAVRILFLKDLFLSRRQLFAYFAAGMVSSALTAIPNSTIAFVGFLLMITVAIASGIHLIGTLMLSESTDQTRLFVMSMPVSLLDYSVGKIAVILTTYLIPWSAMFVSSAILTFVVPSSKHGSFAVLPAIFLFLFCAFLIQLVTAVVSESIGWTISVMVACNVGLNVFLMQLFASPEISAVTKSDIVSWPPVLVQLLVVELLIAAGALVTAFIAQTRKRDLV